MFSFFIVFSGDVNFSLLLVVAGLRTLLAEGVFGGEVEDERLDHLVTGPCDEVMLAGVEEDLGASLPAARRCQIPATFEVFAAAGAAR